MFSRTPLSKAVLERVLMPSPWPWPWPWSSSPC